MPQPLIGLTTHPWDAPDRPSLDRLLDAIVQAVERAGGLPLLLPPALADATLRRIFERLDGVLFTGGGDIDPAHYGGAPSDRLGGVDPARDHLELTLARWTVDEGKPVFGICRGLQTLNVALGGALYGDISEHPDAQRHTYYPGLPFDLRPHPVDITADSTLARIIGEPRVMVNSLHHQAVRVVAPGLRVVARAEDGLVEALEAPGHPFALAVQWHPEALPDAPEMQRLFRAFVDACLSQS